MEPSTQLVNPVPTQSAPRRFNWRKAILISLGTILAIVAVFGGYVAWQPDEFRIVRSTTISAPPSKVFANVNDFHKWEAWSPWAKLDPAAKNSIEGASSGKGAIFKWSGNDQVGEGQMTILESQPGERITIKLDFTRPMQDTSDIEFNFKPAGDQTAVTWSMSGKHTSFIGKAFCTLMNMDKMVGTDFEKGLANMKSVIEAAPGHL